MSEQVVQEQSTPGEEKLTRLINVYVSKNSTLALDNEILKDDLALCQSHIAELEAKLREREVKAADGDAEVGP